MIKPEQIPGSVVWAAADELDDFSGSLREAIAAAINAWPGALQEEGVFTMDDDCLILPLPKEKTDG